MVEATASAGDIKRAEERLRSVLGGYPSLVVAYSGGVDSGLLAYVAHDVLGDRMLAAMASTPSLPESEEEEAVAFVSKHGIPFEQLATREIDNAAYRANTPDRCYHCKTELFDRLHELAASRGFSHVAYGANADDGHDYRPGMAAAGDQHIVAPLVEAGLGKRHVREIARSLGLELWDKPASPCLASRIPYFQEVTREKLAQIDRAERVLKAHGFRICRVRHHGDLARIEIPLEEHPRLTDRAVWQAIADGVRKAGFRYVTLDLEGFRSGRLNDALRKE